MSALLERSVTRTGTQARPRVSHRKEAPQQIRLRARVIRRRSAGPAAILLQKAMMFCGICAVTYLVSCFIGQLALEGARQARLDARHRAIQAKEDEATLNRRLERVTSANGVEDWALAHGFVAPDGQTAKPSNLGGLVVRR